MVFIAILRIKWLPGIKLSLNYMWRHSKTVLNITWCFAKNFDLNGFSSCRTPSLLKIAVSLTMYLYICTIPTWMSHHLVMLKLRSTGCKICHLERNGLTCIVNILSSYTFLRVLACNFWHYFSRKIAVRWFIPFTVSSFA